jgi:hypothetical protein
MVEVPHFDRRVWIGLIAVAVAAGLYLRHRSSSTSATDPTVGDSTDTLGSSTVDGSADPYSSGDVTAIPGTQYGMPGPPGPPGAKGQRGKRGPRGRPPKHKKHRHNTPAGRAAPAIMQQSHMANSTPVQSGVRVVQHRPNGVVQKGARKSNG